jgi:uncharacterized delta-60 repeat protein
MGAFRLIALLGAIFAATQVAAAPDDLDGSFGSGGAITVDPGIIGLQPDGKLILVTTIAQGAPAKPGWLLRRYSVDGTPDLAFGTSGTVIIPPNAAGIGDSPSAIALLDDGRFVIAGSTDLGGCVSPHIPCFHGELIVARFRSDGTLDQSFGIDGWVIDSSHAGASSVAIQPDGAILLQITNALSAGFIERLNADGSPDDSFAAIRSCGPFTLSHRFHRSVDGKIVFAGGLDEGSCIARFNRDGSPDMTFGIAGKAIVPWALFDFIVQSDGGIIVADEYARLLRLNPDGSPDTRFGAEGSVVLDDIFFTTAMVVDCRGRVLIGGLPADHSADYMIVRVLPDGRIDSGFLAAPPTSPTNGPGPVKQILMRSNGRIVVQTESIDDTRVSILQYQGDSPCGTAVEYYYADWNYYFETALADEIAALDSGAFGGAWKRTGESFNVWPQPDVLTAPMCRFFSTAFGSKSSHVYTPFPAECATLKSNPAWQFESIAFYVQIPIGYGTGNGSCPTGTVPLYRAYNNGMGGAPNHRYTTNLATLNIMIAQGWTFEGEANTKVLACVPQ